MNYTTTPFAYVIPGDDNAYGDGWLDCRVSPQGEFTAAVYSQKEIDRLTTELEAKDIEWQLQEHLKDKAVADRDRLIRALQSICIVAVPDYEQVDNRTSLSTIWIIADAALEAMEESK